MSTKTCMQKETNSFHALYNNSPLGDTLTTSDDNSIIGTSGRKESRVS